MHVENVEVPSMETSSGRGRLRVEKILWLYAALILLLEVSAVTVALVRHEMLLYYPQRRFGDLLVYYPRTLHPFGNAAKMYLTFPQMNYPAPGLFAYSIFANLPVHPLIYFWVLLAAAAVGGADFFVRRLMQYGISRGTAIAFGVIALVTSYPIAFEFDRANIELINWILLGVAFGLFAARRYPWSAVFIGLAASTKYFPFCLLLLFIPLRRYRAFLVGCITWAVVTFSAFWAAGPTLPKAVAAYREGNRLLSIYPGTSYDVVDVNYDHGLLALLKQLARLRTGWHYLAATNHLISRMYTPSLVVEFVLFLLCLFALWKRPLLNQIIGLFTLMVLLPPWAYDYNLIELYIPWAMFIFFLCRDAGANDVISRKKIWIFLGCFAVIFTAETYVRMWDAGFGGQIKCVALLTLLWATMQFPVHSYLDQLRGNQPRQDVSSSLK